MIEAMNAQRGAELRIEGVSKCFGPVQALQDVSLTLRPGAIHALVGENGAGKSTLASILYGLHQPDAGEIWFSGNALLPRRPSDAIAAGIGLVHQHFSLIPAFTVLENLMLSDPSAPWCFNQQSAERHIDGLLHQLDIHLPLHQRVEELPVGLQQQVEIAKVMLRRPRVILFDEPTASLLPQEAAHFLESLQSLRAQGLSLLMITHRLSEVQEAADEVTVLRQGQVALNGSTQGCSIDQIAAAMVGHPLQEEQYSLSQPSEVRLKITRLIAKRKAGETGVDEFSLHLKAGEIFGIAGVAGNGQDELVEVLMGQRKLDWGEIKFDETRIQDWKTNQRRRLGFACIPQDRARGGLLMDYSIWENYALNIAKPWSWRFWLPKKRLLQESNEAIQSFHIQADSPHVKAKQLSGGHQQRLLLARELSSQPSFIIADNPTRGLDINAMRFVRTSLVQAAQNGAMVLVISSDLPELRMLCHRIGAMVSGRLTDIRPSDQWNDLDLGRAMGGLET